MLVRRHCKAPLRLLIPTPEVSTTAIEHAHTAMVVCSDGVWGGMSSQTVADFVFETAAEFLSQNLGEQGTTMSAVAQHCAQALVDTAFNRGSMDNITTIVVFFLSIDGLVQTLLAAGILEAA